MKYNGTMQTVYEAAGGRDGLLRLARAWHTRVLEDEVVSHAFSHGYHPQHTERLAAYWAEALGGPTTYSDRFGSETSVVRIHSGNGPHDEMDQRAIACFDQALDDFYHGHPPRQRAFPPDDKEMPSSNPLTGRPPLPPSGPWSEIPGT